ncbi:MAG: NUDIX domain-containing protein [Candidatus Melainabacteria bacterium]|nr:NUDIX domain-containing protein [Candidatus Melainabacteria bacterium]
MKESAGILLYRTASQGLEVLLVHPSGNYNKHAPWGIPKGLPEEGESLEDAARRETFEETGIEVKQSLVSLGHIQYTKSRKRIHCFAAEALPEQIPAILSWEIDKAEFFTFQEAEQCIHPDQKAFLERLGKRVLHGDQSGI